MVIDDVITNAIADYNRLTRGDSAMKYVTYDTKEEAMSDTQALEDLGLICTPPTHVSVVSEDKTQIVKVWLVVAFNREEFFSPWIWQDTN